MSKHDNSVKIMILAVILAVILVGGALAIVVVNNNMQRSNQDAQRAAEQQRNDAESAQERSKSESNSFMRTACLNTADQKYWEYVKLNATSSKETENGPVYYAPNQVWSTAAENKKTATDDCYRQYPNT